LRILALIQGQYGERIVTHLDSTVPTGWAIEKLSAPSVLPPVVDEPDEFLPQAVPGSDLLLALTESMGAAQLVTALARRCGAGSVIMPVDTPAWLLPGMKLQIRRELAREGIASVFPKTFCTLTENGCGFRKGYEEYRDERIAQFAGLFGRPRLEVDVAPDTRRVTKVSVRRGAPCGSTHFVAKKLVGVALHEVLPQAGLIAHYYPCLASMQREHLDEGMFEPLMNVSGYVVNEELERILGPFIGSNSARQ
jgi:hypothetical protein